MLESKLYALRKAPPLANFFQKRGRFKFRYAIVQFRWFMIPSLYRLYDRSSNGEQKDLYYMTVTISRRKATENAASCPLLFAWNHTDL